MFKNKSKIQTENLNIMNRLKSIFILIESAIILFEEYQQSTSLHQLYVAIGSLTL